MKHKNPYHEAIRYLDNARDTLKLAGTEDKFYVNKKYVKTACGTAYSGMLKALDFLFEIKSVPRRRGRKSIEYYKGTLSGLDKKLLKNLNNGYELLHLYGYYDGGTSINSIIDGFDDALSIIETLKPYSKNGDGE
jgi:hypothetical protein